MTETDMQKWDGEDGVVFLRKIGLRPGQTVLDFGCRLGHYSIPAAKLVGEAGVVYAVDKEQDFLDVVQKNAKEKNLHNIKIVNTAGAIHLDLKDDAVDVVLMYDVLHYFDGDKRNVLYGQMERVLRNNGLLSIYPKHTAEDVPADAFEKISVDEVKREVERSGFVFEKKHCDTVSHNNGLNYGCVLNFRKSATSNEEK